MITSTAALWKVNCTHSNACLPDVNCSWPMLLGRDGEEEREHHASHQDEENLSVCLCLLCPTDMLPRSVLLICVMLCKLAHPLILS